jgi:competence protein ComEC
MIETLRGGYKKYTVLLLFFTNVCVWLVISGQANNKVLSIYFLDVGQGDAILIDAPSRARVLIDGGKNRKVLSELGEVMPFGDRRIDIVVGTHPDADHIGGLPEVVTRFNVGVYMEPGVVSDKNISNILEERLSEKGVAKLVARRGMVINLGSGARLSVLSPRDSVSRTDANDASVVLRLDYGEHSVLFTGDASSVTESMLIALDPTLLRAQVLKVGHHGSRTSTSLTFADVVSPEYAIISVSENNSYGHPHKEVLDNLASVGAVTLSTAEHGRIMFKTDGKTLKVKK